jgi:hypothetical protein
MVSLCFQERQLRCCAVQTRYLLIASAIVALLILAAGAAWLLVGFT